MTTLKLIVRNVRRHLRDYLIYFLTLMLAVSLVYAFNSLSDQPALAEMSMTRALLYEQLNRLLGLLSLVACVVLAFLILYANQFLLKRRKKELGLYMMLGMRKGRIARIFAAETFLVGVLSLASGLALGVLLSQGVGLAALRLFAVELAQFELVLSLQALRQTVICFAVIFLLVMALDVCTISRLQLIALFTASRRNESVNTERGILPLVAFLCAIICIAWAGGLYHTHGILPVRGEHHFAHAGFLLAVGTVLLFYALSTLCVRIAQSSDGFYLKGLHTFLVRQVASKLRSNYLIMTIVCGLLTITICAVSIGTSTALTMNKMVKSAVPYDLNVISDVDKDGDGSVADYLRANGVALDDFAGDMTQISIYEADFTYAALFSGQAVDLWPLDEALPDTPVTVIAVSDFNRALAMQGRAAVALADDEYLLNGNYKGTLQYVQAALDEQRPLSIGGETLQPASDTVLEETYWMTQVGNNDRGTVIVPDQVAQALAKDANVLLVQYRQDVNPDNVLQQMLPIGLDDSSGYRYTEKTMLYDMFYGFNAIVSFLCLYVGLIFLLICAALLALKQLTETADNSRRYRLLRHLGATEKQTSRTLCAQIALFFAAPLAVAGVYSCLFVREGMSIVEEFMNMPIHTTLWFTLVLFLLVYGGYFLATYLSCRRILSERE